MLENIHNNQNFIYVTLNYSIKLRENIKIWFQISHKFNQRKVVKKNTQLMENFKMFENLTL